MMTAESRREAWITRRKKYGACGHAGSYSRGSSAIDQQALERCRRAIARLHNEGILSEGQAAKITGLHRIDLRKLCDELENQSLTPRAKPE